MLARFALLALAVIAAACTSAQQQYVARRPNLSCDDANRYAFSSVRSLGYSVGRFQLAQRGTPGLIKASKPGERGPLNALNIMHLGDPQSAIVSAIIFNALIIPALVPLALRGVKYRAIGATALLRRNLLIYGLGGVILPFIGIKLIDLLIHNVFGA